MGCIFSVSVVSSVITRVALSPGMQPATTPSRVAPKASVSETGLRYPTTALPNMTRPSSMACAVSQGRRTRKMRSNVSMTTVATAGANPGPACYRNGGPLTDHQAAQSRRRWHAIGFVQQENVQEQKTGGQRPVVQAAAEQDTAIGHAQQPAQRHSFPVELLRVSGRHHGVGRCG